MQCGYTPCKPSKDAHWLYFDIYSDHRRSHFGEFDKLLWWFVLPHKVGDDDGD